MKTKEQLAEQYAEEQNSSYTNDYYGFLEGFSAKEEQIKEKIELLERSKGFKIDGLRLITVKFSSQQEQMKYAEKVDETIKVLKSLIDED